MNAPESSIIGIGGLGTVLTKALVNADIPVKSIFNRSENKARKLAEANAINTWGTFPSSLDELGTLIFITVSDSSIKDIARRLSQLDGDFTQRTIVHCSGSESSGLLKDLHSTGANIAAFHPLQTFHSQSNPGSFKNIYFTLQGDPQAFPPLQKVARKLDAHTFQVTPEQKSQLHIAAVMASNYLNTLLNRAVEAGSAGGLSSSKVKKALLPLIETTLENSAEYSFVDALTGPIKRGDVATIEKHLRLLEDRDKLRTLYCELGLQTLEVVESSSKLDDSIVEDMRTLLHQQETLPS